MSTNHLPYVLALLCWLLPLVTQAADTLIAYPKDASLAVEDDRSGLVSVSTAVWGPSWKMEYFRGTTSVEGQTSTSRLAASVAGQAAAARLEVSVAPVGPREIVYEYALSIPRDTSLTIACLSINLDARFSEGTVWITEDQVEKVKSFPFGRGRSESVSTIRMQDAGGSVYRLEFEPPVALAYDESARLVLAEGDLRAGTMAEGRIAVRLPADAQWYTAPSQLPGPAGASDWFPWTGHGQLAGSILDLTPWLDAPAGKHGRIVSEGDKLIYQGQPIRLWGVNACFDSCVPDREMATKRAAFYAAHGINSLRMHKYTERGVLSRGSFVAYDSDALDRFDFFVAELKQRGIYTKLSPTFGNVRVGSDDMDQIPFAAEFGDPDRNGWISTPQGALFISTEVQNLLITQMVALMKHGNPHTGFSYAQDPAIAVIELINENDAFFFLTSAMERSATLKARAGQLFTRWLMARYGSQEAILARWGDEAFNSFAHEKFTGESFEEERVYPYGKPWYFDPIQLDGSQAYRKTRLLDTMLFYYEVQNAFYDRYERALREAGYAGELVASNWQAGRGPAHYLNLHSDSQIGIVDRHNYFNGRGDPMLSVPGSGMLSTGMQQVANRPFMLSEWIHVFPAQYGVEGPAIIGAYGMGLQGWDVSYMFQNRDDGDYRPYLGRESWTVMVPDILSSFPVVARQVLRGDVSESAESVARSVNLDAVEKGRLGFEDQVRQGYDDKSFDSRTVPMQTLAVSRCVVSYDDSYRDTPRYDISPQVVDGVFQSTTGQLRWTPKGENTNGFFTINSPATQAVVGFAGDQCCALNDVTFDVTSPFAAIYLTAAHPQETLQSDDRLILYTFARSQNTGMKFVNGKLLQRGQAPILVEPVSVRVALKRPGATVAVLDHNGQRTGKTVPLDSRGSFVVDGAQTQTCYYEIRFD